VKRRPLSASDIENGLAQLVHGDPQDFELRRRAVLTADDSAIGPQQVRVGDRAYELAQSEEVVPDQLMRACGEGMTGVPGA
jgi:hypothetical protein